MIARMVNTWAAWDLALFRGMYLREVKRPTRAVFRLLSRSGDGPLYIAVAGLLLLAGISWAPSFILIGAVAFAIQIPLYKLIKTGCRRPRPFEQHRDITHRIQPPDAWSFPSGHTASAFLFAQLLALFVPVLALPLYAWAGLVGMSRVYLGVHYPTDVMAGAVLGLSLGFLVPLGAGF